MSLASFECSRKEYGRDHRLCPAITPLRDGSGLGAVCLCACHQPKPIPAVEPRSAERAAMLRADWARGAFRFRDLSARYGCSREVARNVAIGRTRTI